MALAKVAAELTEHGDAGGADGAAGARQRPWERLGERAGRGRNVISE